MRNASEWDAGPAQMHQALQALRDMRARLDAVERARTEPIAIIGMGCRFPGGANTPERFWQLLMHRGDAISEVPAERWDVEALYSPDPAAPGKMTSRWGGFVEQVDQFDANFFGIAPREAARMDPQQRLLLEVAWEALEDAGQVIERLAGSSTGVFVGIHSHSNDYCWFQFTDPASIETYTGTGTAHNVMTGRLSYLFDLQGPSVAVDTACSSSLVAVHLAGQSLRTGECRMALAGGVNLMLSPLFSIATSRMNMLAPDGRCKAFDADANGIVRGEGCGVVVLKRLSEALADGDTILAVIRGSAINQDGHTNGLTAPNGLSQQAVIRQALDNAKVAPSEITYVETHGTGTALGDPIEVEALDAVLGRPGPDGPPCVLGAVKSNIGHLEGAAGIAGLIKTVLALQHGTIPPNVHFTQLNPHICLEHTRFVIPTAVRAWPAGPGRRYAGVSSFGWSGTNAHVIIEAAPPGPGTGQAAAVMAGRAHLLPLSTRSPAALQAVAQAYLAFLTAATTDAAVDLQNICYSASMRRSHHPHRMALVGHSAAELVTQLEAWLAGETQPESIAEQQVPSQRPKLVFVCAGQGSQWCGMGQQLFEQEPVFRAMFEQCDALFGRHADWSLVRELAADASQSRLQHTAISQPIIFALQVGLAALWRSWGIVPDAVVGHSMGEVAAAHLAGVLSLDAAVRLIFHRGRLMQPSMGQGQMAAVALSAEQIAPLLEGYEGRLAIAAINRPTATVLSGEPAALEAVLRSLTQQQIVCRLLPGTYAFHSPQMTKVQQQLEQVLDGLQPHSASCPLYSTVTGCVSPGRHQDAAYWGRNAREPVRFAAAVDQLGQDGFEVFLELSPHPVLLGAMAECLAHREQEGTLLASCRRGHQERQVILRTLGRLYTLGYSIDWSRLYPSGGRGVRLPAYPWQRQRYWVPEASPRPGRASLRPLIDTMVQSPLLQETLFESQFSTEALPFLADHRLYGQVVVPEACYISLVLSAVDLAFDAQAYQVHDIVFAEALVLPEGEARTVQLLLTPEEQASRAGVAVSFQLISFAAASRNHAATHAMGKLVAETTSAPVSGGLPALQERCQQAGASLSLYETAEALHMSLGPCFRWLTALWRGEGEALGQLRQPDAVGSLTGYLLHPGLLDACFQLIIATLADGERQESVFPGAIDTCRFYPSVGHKAVWGYARRVGAQRWDLQLLNSTGQVVADLGGLQTRTVPPEALLTTAAWQQWLYQVVWRPQVRFGLSPDDLPTPQQVCQRLAPQGDAMLAPSDLSVYEEAVSHLEALNLTYVLAAFERLGCAFQPGSLWETTQVAEQLGVIDQHRRLWGRLLELLAQAGILQRRGAYWEVVQAPTIPSPAAQRRALVERYAAVVAAELTLLGRCGAQLAEVLRGEIEPLQLLFPAGDLTATTQIYQDSFEARVLNTLAQQAVVQVLGRLPAERGVRVLEIGAGTGGTTAYLLPHLQADRTEYVFTDISAWFTTRAQEKFQAYPFVRYASLDIERAPETQGFTAHQYDVIVAANVLHATRDLRQTLQHVRTLLAPGGLLLLLEVTAPRRWLDSTFGLTTGWWRFADVEVRPDHPLLGPSQWQALLEATGFAEVMALTPRGSQQTMLVAQADHVPERPGRHWLIFADTTGIGQQLAAQLTETGDVATLVRPGDGYAQVAPRSFSLDPASPSDYRRLLEAVPDVHGVVHCWSVEALDPERSAAADVEAAARTGCGSTLSLVQALADLAKPPRLWLITQAAVACPHPQSPGASPPLSGVAQSPLWGMGKVIAQEHPEFHCVRVDVAPDAPVQEAARLLLHDILTPPASGGDGDEDHIAWRDQVRHVARLVRTATPLGDQPLRLEFSVRRDATYLITGGLGGLGGLVARWLVQRGARHLVLVGRRPPRESLRAQLLELEQFGTQVTAAQADVSDRQQVARVLAAIDEAQPLRGIIHAAGVLDDGVLRQQTWERFASVLAPKVQGAWHLHTLTKHLSVDFFVLFSSATSLLGLPGQANHAAANAYLDALAHYRRQQGLPGLSINWGGWSEVGAAAERWYQLHRQGLDAITPEQGLQVLEYLLAAAPTQVGVIPVDWSQFPSHSPFFADLQPVVRPPQQEQPVAFVQQLEAAPAYKRRSLLVAHVCSQVAQVLGHQEGTAMAPSQGFFDLGMDSLMSVELRNRLQISLAYPLPATLAFDYPTVEALVDYLAADVLDLEFPSAETAHVADATADAALDALTPDAIATLLEQELNAFDEDKAR
ncbi:hypothetical protein NKDENANG_00331 [Candidatus Entotheonellaceae bacterium PAL068K]